MDRRQTLERVAAQRAALSASRAGLPGFVLSSKIAPRAFRGVNSPDAACARHALAVAALAARDMPAMYVEQMGQFVINTLEIYQKTGTLEAVTGHSHALTVAVNGPGPVLDWFLPFSTQASWWTASFNGCRHHLQSAICCFRATVGLVCALGAISAAPASKPGG